MKQMLQLTELANTIIESGNMNVYAETYEMIQEKVGARYAYLIWLCVTLLDITLSACRFILIADGESLVPF